MLSDFELIQKHIPQNENIIIFPISDVHLGASEHMETAWNEFVKQIQSIKNSYVVLCGDLINNATKSSVSNVFDDVLRPREQKKRMVEMLDPIKEKILCAVSGNHERRNKDVDDDPMYDIMCKLDLEDLYRENAAFIKLRIGNTSANGLRNPTYTIAVTHGSGGSSLTGSAVNKNERFGTIFDGLDCLITGHTHKPFVTQPCKIVIDPYNNKVSMKPFKVVCCSSWLSYGGYALQKMLLPSSHAIQIITLNGKKKEIKVTM